MTEAGRTDWRNRVGVRRRNVGVDRRYIGANRRYVRAKRRYVGVGRRDIGAKRRYVGVGRRDVGAKRRCIRVGMDVTDSSTQLWRFPKVVQGLSNSTMEILQGVSGFFKSIYRLSGMVILHLTLKILSRGIGILQWDISMLQVDIGV